MQEQTEVNLIDKIRESDAIAFSELYEKYWKELYVYALQKIGNKEDVADIIQNIFVELWDKRKRIPVIRTKEKHYLSGILVHKIARYYRTKGVTEKHNKNFQSFVNQYDKAPGDIAKANEKENDYIQLLDFVDKQVACLPEKMRNVFLLSCTREYSIVEIAAIFKIAPQTVKNQISTALSRIRYATREYKLAKGELLLVLLLFAENLQQTIPA